jgi:hypothetical protein
MLGTHAREFLLAGGFAISREAPGFLEATRSVEGRPAERLLVWIDERRLPPTDSLGAAEKQAREADEQQRLAAIARELKAAPGARGQMLVAGRQGYSQRFTTEVPRLLGEGSFRVPVQFFDAAYAQDQATGKRVRAGVFGNLLARAEAEGPRRIAQPFVLRNSLDGAGGTPGGDLVEHLETALADPPDAPRLFVIDGHAGGGKSFAFNQLVAKLYREFTAAKQAMVPRSRPIPFLPDYLRGADAVGYVRELVRAVAQTEMGGVVPADQLNWLARNGYATWMFDGLDEFYDGSEDFFPFLASLLGEPGSRAQVLICTRDSLLSSSARMRAFLQDERVAPALQICELQPWGPKAWRNIAELELESGRKGPSPKVDAFLATVEASPSIAEVAALPFYCTILIDHAKRHGALLPAAPSGLRGAMRQLLRSDGTPLKDDLDVLELLVEKMFDREHDKAIFRWRDFVDAGTLDDEARLKEAIGDAADGPDAAAAQAILDEVLHAKDGASPLAQALDEAGRRNLVDLIGSVAWARRRRGVGGEPASDELTGAFDQTFADPDPDAAGSKLERVLVQFAFFGAGRNPGAIDFSHPILADYLAGKHAADMLNGLADSYAAGGMRPEAIDVGIRTAIGTTELPAGSVFERAIAREARRESRLAAMLEDARDRGKLAEPAAGAVKRICGG